MVVGVSNEGISLISKLGPEVNVDTYLEDRFWGGTFEKHLGSYAKNYDGVKDVSALGLPTSAPESVTVSESEVRSRTPSLRETIKEKLTKLKPLA